MALDYSKVRFLWRGDSGRKVSSLLYDKIYDMGPRAASGDATFATAATRPIVDELSGWYGLAVDPAATNLLLQSEVFSNASWIKNSSTVSANVAVAPDGTTTADKSIVNNGITLGISTGAGLRQDWTKAASSITYTQSVFAKADGFQNIILYLSNGPASNGAYCVFNLINGVTGANATFGSGFSGLSGRIENHGNGWFRCIMTVTSDTSTTMRNSLFPSDPVVTTGNGSSGVLVWGSQLETGSVATQYKKTEASTTSYSAVVAPITDAIPVIGTIIMWDNMVNAYASGYAHRFFDSEEISSTQFRLRKDDGDVNDLEIRVHNGTTNETTLEWQPTNQRKRWFFAVTYDGSTVQVYRGDVQGNITKVIDGAYTATQPAVRDMYLHTSPAGVGQIGASYLDILTYDDVLTQADIEAIFYGNIPIFQQTGYSGTFVDKFRQKVQAEPASTYITTLEADVLATWSAEL